ncbi:MAG: class I SAM-dependent methyltransferase [Ruminococcus sp.]|nr:class I SAM-dependent methyltransferase [Ruminococcus sp.]
MFWDYASSLYDVVETVYNKRVYRGVGEFVADLIDADDVVLECACGTGAISLPMAMKCKKLIATDFSVGMLKQTAKKCRNLKNVLVRRANIMDIKCKDESFDKVVAGNVIHLLDNPESAIAELKRVCKNGGKIIIPTYINKANKSASIAVKFFDIIGADFKRQFNFASYKQFFKSIGYGNAEFYVVNGRMACAVAVITNTNP